MRAPRHTAVAAKPQVRNTPAGQPQVGVDSPWRQPPQIAGAGGGDPSGESPRERFDIPRQRAYGARSRPAVYWNVYDNAGPDVYWTMSGADPDRWAPGEPADPPGDGRGIDRPPPAHTSRP